MGLPLVFVKEPEANKPPELPTEPGIHYLLGANGVFKYVNNDYYTACVKSTKAPGLAVLCEKAKINLKSLPRELLGQVETFFRDVWKKYKSEAVVVLYANPVTKEWRVMVPKQKVSSAHADYEMTGMPVEVDGFRQFGSIHSHGSMGAFHSSTDTHDEVKWDGLHITIGKIDEAQLQYSARWMLSGSEFKCDLSEWVEQLPEVPSPKDWIDQVEEKKTVGYGGVGPLWQGAYGANGEFGNAFEDDDEHWKTRGFSPTGQGASADDRLSDNNGGQADTGECFSGTNEETKEAAKTEAEISEDWEASLKEFANCDSTEELLMIVSQIDPGDREIFLDEAIDIGIISDVEATLLLEELEERELWENYNKHDQLDGFQIRSMP